MNHVIEHLRILKSKLEGPFPYADMERLKGDFRSEFLTISDEEDCITGDFNSYSMNIAGTLSYVLAGKMSRIPRKQIEMLHLSFFDFFPQYKFLEGNIGPYKDFNEEYHVYEETRILLLQVVKEWE